MNIHSYQEKSLSRSPYSVFEITQYIKEQLEADPALQDIWIAGEISNWVRSRAGHCYFTLKDARATIRSVIWRTTAERLVIAPEDGQYVLAHGYVSVYEPQGQYQFYVDQLLAAGRGVLYLQFEQLKERLEREGLFDADRKRPLPAFPSCIAVVTSPQGAAFRDICNVLSRRWPLARVLLSPTLVQGEEAPRQIVRALHRLYRRTDIDLVVIARGGGSIEDLWAFNDEQVARAIAESPKPVVTGIGHETDFTIADFVADRRAPTPSAAAEVATPDQVEIRQQLAALAESLQDALERQTAQKQQVLRAHMQTLVRSSPRSRISQERQAIDDLQRRTEQAWRHLMALLREHLSGTERRLRGLDPQATLKRGYAVVRRQDGQVVRQVSQIAPGDKIAIRVSDGGFDANVTSSEMHR
jgi:exodeoxyribonuclease VII large subunit